MGIFKRKIGVTKAQKALRWLKSNELQTGGITVYSKSDNAYPEVTGYLVPTLFSYGQKEQAIRFLDWLSAIQQLDGSFTDPQGNGSYAFDTGQVLRGFIAGYKNNFNYKNNIKRATEYLLSQLVVDDGTKGFKEAYKNTSIPESVLLYAIPPLIKALKILELKEKEETIQNCINYYLDQEYCLNLDTLTHFLAYEIEALIDLGMKEKTLEILNKLKQQQQKDGSVRGIEGEQFVCTTGLAQLAICWYKTGKIDPADRAMTWLEKNQKESGAFFGSVGKQASYFQNQEISWGVKFYLDANLLRIKSFFDINANIFPDTVSDQDGRLQFIANKIKENQNIVEIGCGKGRFLKALQKINNGLSLTGVDISPELLSTVPNGINKILGSLENIPLKDDSFDVVFSVEAIEHSVNQETAIDEMIRILKPGGWIVVIDKQESQWGRLKTPTWERWPNKQKLESLLNKHCDTVSSTTVSYDGKKEDKLMVGWQGQKRSLLTASEWNKTLISNNTKEKILNSIKTNKLTEWGKQILLETSPKEKVLEIGSGTGEISLKLALSGRDVTALDLSKQSLDFIESVGKELGLEIKTACTDATKKLPYKTDTFDCTWSSGLLEHFSTEEQINMLQEFSRVTKGKVITMVPNASSLAYQLGKKIQEERGIWRYGYEAPLATMQNLYNRAGMKIITEFSIAPFHSLNFLPENSALKIELSKYFKKLSEKELTALNQGYLLVTIGEKI